MCSLIFLFAFRKEMVWPSESKVYQLHKYRSPVVDVMGSQDLMRHVLENFDCNNLQSMCEQGGIKRVNKGMLDFKECAKALKCRTDELKNSIKLKVFLKYADNTLDPTRETAYLKHNIKSLSSLDMADLYIGEDKTLNRIEMKEFMTLSEIENNLKLMETLSEAAGKVGICKVNLKIITLKDPFLLFAVLQAANDQADSIKKLGQVEDTEARSTVAIKNIDTYHVWKHIDSFKCCPEERSSTSWAANYVKDLRNFELTFKSRTKLNFTEYLRELNAVFENGVKRYVEWVLLRGTIPQNFINLRGMPCTHDKNDKRNWKNILNNKELKHLDISNFNCANTILTILSKDYNGTGLTVYC